MAMHNPAHPGEFTIPAYLDPNNLGEENVPGVFSDPVIHWHMVNQDESALIAGLS